MNPYQVMGLIACCTSLFAAVVSFLILQGMPWPAALLLVYLVAVGCMLGMQWRAREGRRSRESRRPPRERPVRQIPPDDPFRPPPVSLRKSSGL